MILKILIIIFFFISYSFSNENNDLFNFNNNVEKGLDYLRIDYSIINNTTLVDKNNNTIFEITINPRRNNYEEVLMMTFSCIGKIIKKR